MGFALLNVVNSVFVSQTLKIAESDEEYLIKVRKHNQAQYRKKLETLFKAADVTNDGFLSMASRIFSSRPLFTGISGVVDLLAGV